MQPLSRRPSSLLSLPLALTLAFLPLPIAADPNVNQNQSASWGANVGWIHWRPDASSGVQITEFTLSGFLYSANLGWIHLGSGTPANGKRYQNNSASDYGVNIDAAGKLRGFAYSPNAGWIQFEDLGNPALNWTSGQISGAIHGANIGWIQLSSPSHPVLVDSIARGADTDRDGLPDAWELTYAADLTQLHSSADTDQDQQTDFQEYLADTDPANPADFLRIDEISPLPNSPRLTLSWDAKPTRRYRLQSRSSLLPSSVWSSLSFDWQMTSQNRISQTLTNSGSTLQLFRLEATLPLPPQ